MDGRAAAVQRRNRGEDEMEIRAFQPLSLAQVDVNETVRVEGFVFGMVRDLCDSIGLHEGDVVRCRANGAATVILEGHVRGTLVVDQDWARFVQVKPIALPPERYLA
jgi:hypothetical protein